jgi:hypothetical protein
MVKKTRNSTKIPELSTSAKVNHYKGVTRTLRKRVDNLEARLYEVETRINKYKHLLADECINSKKGKNIEPDIRDEFDKRYNPRYNEDDGQ